MSTLNNRSTKITRTINKTKNINNNNNKKKKRRFYLIFFFFFFILFSKLFWSLSLHLCLTCGLSSC